MMMLKAIVLFGILSIVLGQMNIGTGSGGFVGHRIVSSGGFTGNSGLLSGGGFVGHQNVPMVTSGGFVGHRSSIQSFPSNGRFFYSSPIGSSRIMPNSISSAPFRSSIYSPVPMIATAQPSMPVFRRFRRSIDGIRNYEGSQTVYYGTEQQSVQQPKQLSSSSSSYGQSSMSGYNYGASVEANPKQLSSSSSYGQSSMSGYNYDTSDETKPKPYQFSLQSQDDGTGTANWYQQEQSNGDGVIVGSYTIQDPVTGTMRIVNYRADDDGFHAEIQSNEPGVVDSNPADASIRTIQNNVGSVRSDYSAVSGVASSYNKPQQQQQYKQKSYGVSSTY
uniref:Uncharacterized protein LOC113792519 isoform X2 n=1 Tax=Dermatophagoides pteronyssinus TaxID=6956 RepID=A0A6P6XYT8_DERPT|nr:uncharacterized protein LOC113792519 isoform X2 [Dermatophagoides pteronyssinus]